jgi:hypothetical protein
MESVQDVCPECGLPRERWPQSEDAGYRMDGVLYCSEACAAKARARD